MDTVLRADHIGSLLRPARLLEARRSGDPELLRQIEEAILRVFANQKELGFGAATDGEFRRRNFMSDFTDAVEGIDLGDAVGRQWHAEQTADAPMSSVTGIVTSNRPLTGHELAFLKANSPQQGLSV